MSAMEKSGWIVNEFHGHFEVYDLVQVLVFTRRMIS